MNLMTPSPAQIFTHMAPHGNLKYPLTPQRHQYPLLIKKQTVFTFVSCYKREFVHKSLRHKPYETDLEWAPKENFARAAGWCIYVGKNCR